MFELTDAWVPVMTLQPAPGALLHLVNYGCSKERYFTNECTADVTRQDFVALISAVVPSMKMISPMTMLVTRKRKAAVILTMRRGESE